MKILLILFVIVLSTKISFVQKNLTCMKKILLLPLMSIFLLVFNSCENKPKKIKPIPNNWETLKIEVDDKLIWIQSNQDSCFYRDKNGEKRFVLSEIQRDSLFNLGEDAIKNFKYSKTEVSCNAGQNVSITLDNSHNSITCSYKSISNWTQITKTLKIINSMTFSKIPDR